MMLHCETGFGLALRVVLWKCHNLFCPDRLSPPHEQRRYTMDIGFPNYIISSVNCLEWDCPVAAVTLLSLPSSLEMWRCASVSTVTVPAAVSAAVSAPAVAAAPQTGACAVSALCGVTALCCVCAVSACSIPVLYLCRTSIACAAVR